MSVLDDAPLTKTRLTQDVPATATSMTGNSTFVSSVQTAQSVWGYNNLRRRRRAEIVENYFADRNNVWKGYRYLDHLHALDWGGPFDCIKQEYSESPAMADCVTYWNGQRYRWLQGRVNAYIGTITPNSNLWPSGHRLSNLGATIGISNDLDALGTRALYMTARIKPRASLAQSLIELRTATYGRLPDFTIRGRGRGDASGDYLSIIFGSFPLVKDIQSCLQNVINSAELLSAYKDGAFRPMRRSMDFPSVETQTTVVTPSQYGTPMGVTQLYSKSGSLTTTTTTRVKRWFSGRELYEYPISDSLTDRLNRAASDARYLLGLDLTPATVWSVLPWSWFADWFVNTGEVIRALTSATYDGNLWQYAYLMEESEVKVRYELSGVTLINGQILSGYQELNATRKRRAKATPFGFGLRAEAFSATQLSILAALKANFA